MQNKKLDLETSRVISGNSMKYFTAYLCMDKFFVFSQIKLFCFGKTKIRTKIIFILHSKNGNYNLSSI